MKVLEVVDLSPKKFGSFEKYCLGFGVYLRDKGHEHTACFNGDSCKVLKDELQKVGGAFENLYFHNLGVVSTFLLVKYIYKHKIDVVHFHFYPIYSVFSFVSKFLPYKVFYSYRISGEFSDNNFWVMFFKKLRSKILGAGIDGVFCVSAFAREKFINNYRASRDESHVVHNGLNWDYFPEIKAGVRDDDRKDFRVICVASLIQDKGIIDVIKAVEEVKDNIPSIHLSIVGKGEDRSSFEAYVQSAGLENHVSFLGSRDDVPHLLGESDVAVVPSRWGEAFGFTVIEAMAAGLPVVASAVGGIPEIIHHEKTGLLVQKAAPDEIADELFRLYEDTEFRSVLGSQAQEKVKDYFNVNRVYGEQLAYYIKEN